MLTDPDFLSWACASHTLQSRVAGMQHRLDDDLHRCRRGAALDGDAATGIQAAVKPCNIPELVATNLAPTLFRLEEQ